MKNKNLFTSEVNAMTADDLVIQATRASAAMVLTTFSCIILAKHQKGYDIL